MKSVQEIIQAYEKIGVILSSSGNGGLVIEMSKDLTAIQYEELRSNKVAILDYLTNKKPKNLIQENQCYGVFDELGFVGSQYDSLSNQYQSESGSFWSRWSKQFEITPQQALGINISELERQIIDFLKENGTLDIKIVAKKLGRDEQAIRQTVQKSVLIEYRKTVFNQVVCETLLLNEVNYPARFVSFVELQQNLTIDDTLFLIEKCEVYIKQNDSEYCKEWVDFSVRFVNYYRDNDDVVITLKKALVYRF
jgi:hypothetical protein